jgi:MscS family membrane protein
MKPVRTLPLALAYCLGILVVGYAADELPKRLGSGPLLFGVAPWQFALLAVLLAFSVVAYLFGSKLAAKVAWVRDRFSNLPPLDTVALRRAAGIVLACLTARWFLETVELAPHPLHLALLALDSTLILGLVLLAIALWDAVCDRVAQRAVNNDRAERLLVPVTRKMVRMVILFAGVFVVLGVYGVNVTGLIAGLGIGGLAMALAAKDSVENVFGSLTILFDMPFAIGDWVKIDKVEGVVEEINLRSTRIRTFEDTVIMLPNANLIRVGVENFGARRTRRQRISARISYDVDLVGLESYCQAIRDYLESLDYVPKDRSIVALEEFSEPSMGLLVQTYFVASSQAEELGYRDDLLRTILKLREVHGVYFSSPVRPPIAHKETKP